MPHMTGDYARGMAENISESTAEIDVQTLRIVKAIADEGSVTGAAIALGYSQPAISQHLKRLENRLGVALVERVGRGVRLTDAGRVLARHAPAVTTVLDAAAGELAELRGLRAGRVRLVAFPSASPTVVQDELTSLSAVLASGTATAAEVQASIDQMEATIAGWSPSTPTLPSTPSVPTTPTVPTTPVLPTKPTVPTTVTVATTPAP